jgi:hypothetical protein
MAENGQYPERQVLEDGLDFAYDEAGFTGHDLFGVEKGHEIAGIGLAGCGGRYLRDICLSRGASGRVQCANNHPPDVFRYFGSNFLDGELAWRRKKGFL